MLVHAAFVLDVYAEGGVVEICRNGFL